MVNLHFWKTKNPLLHHFHFHVLLFPYAFVKAFDDPENGEAFELVRRQFPIAENGKRMPFTEAQLDQLKTSWKKAVLNCCFRHGVSCPSLEAGGDVDIFFKYIDLSTGKGKAYFVHRLKYQTRPPIVDFTKYSNRNLDCAWPSEKLLTYTNRTRVYGWLGNRKAMVPEKPSSAICKLSPFDSKPMTYVGVMTLNQVLAQSGGKLGTLDFRKGKPIFGNLTEAQLAWLKAADYSALGNPGQNLHEYCLH